MLSVDRGFKTSLLIAASWCVIDEPFVSMVIVWITNERHSVTRNIRSPFVVRC